MNIKNLIYLLLIFLITSCQSIKQGLISHQSPYEEYLSSLQQAGLDEKKLGQAWINASEQALKNAVNVNLPFSESLAFDLNHVSAVAYSLDMREGQELHIHLIPEINKPAHFFIDLYSIDGNEFKSVAYAEADSLNLHQTIKRSGKYIVRIQPELLTAGLYTVYLFTNSSLNFPVEGKSFKSISSFFGDPRDGGRRKHHGVDIFAPKGTPALAVAPGRVSRTGTNNLGGNVVWVTDVKRGYNYYYAHLDTQLVKPGTRIKAGDTIGLIGNTGNARSTPPHLHFGIYAFGRKVVDPYPFFHYTQMQHNAQEQIRQFAGKWGTTNASLSNFREAPSMNATVISGLENKTPIYIYGISGDWLRAELPGGESGYIHSTLVRTIDNNTGEYTATEQLALRKRPMENADAIDLIDKKNMVEVYAEYNSWLLVKTENKLGWIKAVFTSKSMG